jgi:hypothetical protein
LINATFKSLKVGEQIPLAVLKLQRDALVGAFIFKRAAVLVCAVTSLGYARTYWPLDWSAESLSLFGSYAAVLAAAGRVWFHVRFM